MGDLAGPGGHDAQAFGIGLVLAMEVPNLFSAPLPSKMTIATFGGGGPEKLAHTAKWIRSGEVEAVLQAILIGIGGSLWQHSHWPFVLVMAMTVWKVWSYEDSLRRGATEGPGLDMAGQGG